jgi:hypothetical protein
MMPYTLAQLPQVRNEMLSIWLAASDKQAVTDAMAQIEQLLWFAPDSVGSECGDHRELTIAPLTVAYLVSPDDRQVVLLQIRNTG